jgi:hypothetical protein
MGVIAAFNYIIGSARANWLINLLITTEPFAAMLLGALVILLIALVSGGGLTRFAKSSFLGIWSCCRPVFSLIGLTFGDDDINLFVRIFSYALLFPILVFTVAAAHDFLTKTWPINLWVLIVILSLAIANRRALSDTSAEAANMLERAMVSVLVPIAFGLAGVLCLQLAFNLFDFDIENIRNVENLIGTLTKKSGWLDFSPASSAIMTVGVIILGLFVSRWKIVSSYLSLKGLTHKAIATLTCLSSFTFFSQAPLRHFTALDEKRITAQKRAKPETRDSRELAIQAVGRAMQNLSNDDRRYYSNLLTSADSDVPYRYKQVFLHDLVQERLKRVDPGKALEQSDDNAIPSISPGESSDTTTTTHRVVQDETLAGLQDLFSGMIGAFQPEIKGLAGKFVEELVDQASEKIFDNHIRPDSVKAFDYAEARVQPWVTQTLSTRTDRAKEKQAGSSPLDMAALREEIRTDEERFEEQEQHLEFEKQQAEEIRKPTEHIE